MYNTMHNQFQYDQYQPGAHENCLVGAGNCHMQIIKIIELPVSTIAENILAHIRARPSIVNHGC
jgi:hypothetical protein